MRKIKHLLCLFLLVCPLSWAENTRKDVRKASNVTNVNENGAQVHGWSQPRARRLFARQKKQKSKLVTPARRCGRLMESCSSHLPCCDPCASCRCRLFKTICYCWRSNSQCMKMT